MTTVRTDAQRAEVAALRQRYQELLNEAAEIDVVRREDAESGRAIGLPLSWVLPDRIKRARETGHMQLTLIGNLVNGATRASDAGADVAVLIREINKYLPRCEGYIQALRDVGVERSALANKAKTKAAEDKLEDIRRRFTARRWASKSQAATLIAGEVSMSAEVVRRHLTALFPGDSWKKPRVSSNPPTGE